MKKLFHKLLLFRRKPNKKGIFPDRRGVFFFFFRFRNARTHRDFRKSSKTNSSRRNQRKRKPPIFFRVFRKKTSQKACQQKTNRKIRPFGLPPLSGKTHEILLPIPYALRAPLLFFKPATVFFLPDKQCRINRDRKKKKQQNMRIVKFPKTCFGFLYFIISLSYRKSNY